MIKSMTGFGRGEYNDGKRNIVVEIKSVNHRYSDINVKMPRKYSFLEDKLKAKVKESLKRGKVDISVNVDNLTENDTVIKLNLPVARQYYDSLVELKDTFNLNEEISLRLMAQLPDVLKSQSQVEDEEELTRAILIPTELATKNLEEMRAVEGERLKEDLIIKGDNIAVILSEIEGRTSNVVKQYKDKLKDKIMELLESNVTIPEDRILVEAAIFADKCAIDEEITRLKSHLIQLKDILNGKESTVGKKLDFLVQEMNREANTIGSKANDILITNNMLNIKAEIEKIREQVQNIE